MGVLTDYFRAADAASVVRELERRDGGPLLGAGDPAFDGVEAKWMDPHVVLGGLVAAIRRVPWSVGLVGAVTVWPTTPPPGADGPADDDDPWVTGPWVSELSVEVRDTLAVVEDAEPSDVADGWMRAEELADFDAAHVPPLVGALVRLSRRARAADERLYCWTCL